MAALDRLVSKDFLITAAIAGCGGAVWFGVSTVEHQLHLALAGGALVCLADLASRTLAAPRQLPVGAVMALIGAPVFIALLRRSAPAGD